MRKSVLICILITLFFYSCNNSPLFGPTREGIIYYDISYISNRLQKVPTGFLPKTMILKYKNHLSINTIDGFMGLFSISYISNLKKGVNITLLKVMDNKYYYIGKKGGNPCGFDDLSGMSIELKPETKKILGHDCQKVMITFPFAKRDSFEAYYTYDFKVSNPNKTNPYRDIQGVLMQFNVKLSQIEMKFTATRFKNEKVNETIFNIPEGYQLISEAKMIELINKLME